MIFLVTIIQSEIGLKKYQKTLQNLIYEDFAESEIIVFSDLFQIEEILSKKRVVWHQYPLEDFREWRRNLKNDIVIYWNEQIVLLGGEITKLKSDLIMRPAGFIAGCFIEFPLSYKVNDVYSPTEKYEIKRQGELQEIDIAYPYFFITKGEEFKLLNFEDKTFFGLGLRKLGYQNYLDNRIEVGYNE